MDNKVSEQLVTSTIEKKLPTVRIYPNPTTDYIYINQNDIDHMNYKVFDLSGRLIEEFNLSDKNQSVMKSVQHWSEGYNIVKLVKDGKPIGSMKVLKI